MEFYPRGRASRSGFPDGAWEPETWRHEIWQPLPRRWSSNSATAPISRWACASRRSTRTAATWRRPSSGCAARTQDGRQARGQRDGRGPHRRLLRQRREGGRDRRDAVRERPVGQERPVHRAGQRHRQARRDEQGRGRARDARGTVRGQGDRPGPHQRRRRRHPREDDPAQVPAASKAASTAGTSTTTAPSACCSSARGGAANDELLPDVAAHIAALNPPYATTAARARRRDGEGEGAR